MFAVAALGLGAAGCSDDDLKDQSLCAVYESYLDDLAAIQDLDLESLSAAEAAEVAEAYVVSVQNLQRASDEDRHNNGLVVLEATARDLLRTLETVPDGVAYETWSPLVEDDLQDVRNAAVVVDGALEAQCPQAGAEQ